MHWLLRRMLLLVVATSLSTTVCDFARTLAGDFVRHAWPYDAPQTRTTAHNQLSDAPLIITYQPRAARTEVADRAGIAGVVKLHMMLNKDGTVSSIAPVETLPGGLTERAVEAAKQIKFKPAIVGGQYVDAEQLVEYKFPLPTDMRNHPRSRTWLFIQAQPAPYYPEAARQKKVTGSVYLRVVLDKNGRVSEVIPMASTLPNDLLAEVINAATRIKYTPPSENGKPLSVLANTECGYQEVSFGHRTNIEPFCTKLLPIDFLDATSNEYWPVIYE